MAVYGKAVASTGVIEGASTTLSGAGLPVETIGENAQQYTNVDGLNFVQVLDGRFKKGGSTNWERPCAPSGG
jgi:hypothetical protein